MHNASLTTSAGWKVNPKRPIQPLLPWTSIPKGVNVSDCKSKAIIRKTKLNFLMSSAGIIMQATPTISPRTQNPPCFSAWDHGDWPLAIIFTEELENTIITPKMVRIITETLNP